MFRTPRINYSTYSEAGRIRHSRNLKGWLAERGIALGRTSSEIFELLKLSSAVVLSGMTTIISINRTLPTIAGTTASGSTLTATVGTWSGTPAPVLTQEWLRDNVAISGATGLTYLLVAGDVGTKISVRETATNSSGAAIATSLQTVTIT